MRGVCSSNGFATTEAADAGLEMFPAMLTRCWSPTLDFGIVLWLVAVIGRYDEGGMGVLVYLTLAF